MTEATPARDNDSFGERHQQSINRSVEEIDSYEPSYSHNARTPAESRRNRINPEQSENITPEKSRNSITRGTTS